MRRRLLIILFLLLLGGGSVCWLGYQAVHRSALDHELIVASAFGSPETVEALLNRGANADARESTTGEVGWRHFLDILLHRKLTGGFICPLSQALAPGEPDAAHLKIIRILLEHHANPNVPLPDGSPLPTRRQQAEDGSRTCG